MGEFAKADYTPMKDTILSYMPTFWMASKSSLAGMCGMCQMATQFFYLRYNKTSVNDPDYLFSDKILVRKCINSKYAELAYNVIELRNYFAHAFGTQHFYELLDVVSEDRKDIFKMLIDLGCMPTSSEFSLIKEVGDLEGHSSPTEFLLAICNKIHPHDYKVIMREVNKRKENH